MANTSKAPVTREAKASKECPLATADVAAPAEVVAAPGLAQVTRVFNADLTCCDIAEHHAFHKNKGCCIAAIIAWKNK